MHSTSQYHRSNSSCNGGQQKFQRMLILCSYAYCIIKFMMLFVNEIKPWVVECSMYPIKAHILYHHAKCDLPSQFKISWNGRQIVCKFLSCHYTPHCHSCWYEWINDPIFKNSLSVLFPLFSVLIPWPWILALYF